MIYSGQPDRCGCCGEVAPIIRDGFRRCDKHDGRNPCVIDGCGRTFRNEGDYDAQYLCGRHYRMAPRAWRDTYRDIHKIGRRKGWNPARITIANNTFRRIVEYVRGVVSNGPELDIAAIEREFG